MCYLNKKISVRKNKGKKELIPDAQVYVKSVTLVLYHVHQLKWWMYSKYDIRKRSIFFNQIVQIELIPYKSPLKRSLRTQAANAVCSHLHIYDCKRQLKFRLCSDSCQIIHWLLFYTAYNMLTFTTWLYEVWLRLKEYKSLVSLNVKEFDSHMQSNKIIG